jgi:hypothetical protein
MKKPKENKQARRNKGLSVGGKKSIPLRKAEQRAPKQLFTLPN